jgi:hypothetical protein
MALTGRERRQMADRLNPPPKRTFDLPWTCAEKCLPSAKILGHKIGASFDDKLLQRLWCL